MRKNCQSKARPLRGIIAVAVTVLAGLAAWFLVSHPNMGGQAKRSDPILTRNIEIAAKPVPNVAPASKEAVQPAPVRETIQIRKEVSQLVNMDAHSPVRLCIETVWKLGRNLNRAEIEQLYSILRRPQVPSGIKPADYYWVFNDIQDVLVTQSEQKNVSDLGSLLIEIARDQTRDVVLRDYSIQHLGAWYERAGNKSEIENLLWGSLNETDSSIAGTALLALDNLQQTYPEIPAERIQSEALKLASSSSTGELTRITALAIAGKRAPEATIPIAKEILRNTSSVYLKLAALGALGKSGNPDVARDVQVWASSGDRRLQVAATAALKTLKKSGT